MRHARLILRLISTRILQSMCAFTHRARSLNAYLPRCPCACGGGGGCAAPATHTDCMISELDGADAVAAASLPWSVLRGRPGFSVWALLKLRHPASLPAPAPAPDVPIPANPVKPSTTRSDFLRSSAFRCRASSLNFKVTTTVPMNTPHTQMRATRAPMPRLMMVAKSFAATGGYDGGAGPRHGVPGIKCQSGRHGGCGGGAGGEEGNGGEGGCGGDAGGSIGGDGGCPGVAETDCSVVRRASMSQAARNQAGEQHRQRV